MNEARTCRLCKQTKSLDQFEKDSRCKNEDKRTTRCRECKKGLNKVAYKAFYRLKERSDTPIEVTKEEITKLFATFDGTCAYCSAKTDETPHLEHIVPISDGGRNHISNLVIACRQCNFKKGSKPVVTHFFNSPEFKDANFSFLAQYVAIQSDQPVEDIVLDMADRYATYYCEKVLLK